MHFISGQLISLTNPMHRILGHFVNKPQILFCDRALLIIMINVNGTPLVRPPLLYQKSVLSRGVAFHQGFKSDHLCLDLHCQVAFPEGVASCQGGLSKGVPLYARHNRDIYKCFNIFRQGYISLIELQY